MFPGIYVLYIGMIRVCKVVPELLCCVCCTDRVQVVVSDIARDQCFCLAITRTPQLIHKLKHCKQIAIKATCKHTHHRVESVTIYMLYGQVILELLPA